MAVNNNFPFQIRGRVASGGGHQEGQTYGVERDNAHKEILFNTTKERMGYMNLAKISANGQIMGR